MIGFFVVRLGDEILDILVFKRLGVVVLMMKISVLGLNFLFFLRSFWLFRLNYYLY